MWLAVADGKVFRTSGTWSQGTDSQFPNPNSAVDLLRLRNGHLLLIYNDSMSQRTPMTLIVQKSKSSVPATK